MAYRPDTDEVIRSGAPPGSAPFLLDPSYQGTLESGAFRQRFASLAAMPRNIPAYGCYAIVYLLFNAAPLVLYFFTGDSDYLMAAASLAIGTVTLGGFFAWVWGRGFRYLLRQRRLAWRGRLVPGTILVARRTRQNIPGSDFTEGDDSYTIVALEVEYQARTPWGTHIKGANLFRRDDLLNAELPEPGTPVWVLVLDDATHAVL